MQQGVLLLMMMINAIGRTRASLRGEKEDDGKWARQRGIAP